MDTTNFSDVKVGKLVYDPYNKTLGLIREIDHNCEYNLNVFIEWFCLSSTISIPYDFIDTKHYIHSLKEYMEDVQI